MVQHRCTRCKGDVGEYGTRHKYAGGLFCEPCIRALHQGSRIAGGGFFGILSFVYDALKLIHRVIFRPKTKTVPFNVKSRVAYNVMKASARDIPRDARIAVPQKR